MLHKNATIVVLIYYLTLGLGSCSLYSELRNEEASVNFFCMSEVMAGKVREKKFDL